MTAAPASIAELLDALWRDYAAITPQAQPIHDLFTGRGDTVFNDHVALRSVARPGVGIDALARRFVARGWQARDRYRFDDKHLRACYFQHPDPAWPKVFISELVVDELPAAAAAAIDGLLAQLPAGFGDRDDLPWAGRPWTLDHATYRALLADSEYAAWLAAFGFRVNHFTIDVGRLGSVDGLTAVNQLVAGAGFELATEGGLIKGSPAQLLEQSSTRAGLVEVAFSDGVYPVRSCYYEFALRHRLPSGELFHGFVPGSADKLFHATDAG